MYLKSLCCNKVSWITYGRRIRATCYNNLEYICIYIASWCLYIDILVNTPRSVNSNLHETIGSGLASITLNTTPIETIIITPAASPCVAPSCAPLIKPKISWLTCWLIRGVARRHPVKVSVIRKHRHVIWLTYIRYVVSIYWSRLGDGNHGTAT